MHLFSVYGKAKFCIGLEETAIPNALELFHTHQDAPLACHTKHKCKFQSCKWATLHVC